MGCTSEVMYYDGGELLLQSYDVFIRHQGAVTQISHHKQLQFHASNHEVDMLALPRTPGAPATTTRVPASLFDNPPPLAVRGVVDHSHSKGQGHRIRLTDTRRAQLRSHLSTQLAAQCPAGGNVEAFVSSRMPRYARDWYTLAEHRGPDRVLGYADRARTRSTDVDAILDAVDFELPTLRERAWQRSYIADARTGDLVSQLNVVPGATPSRALVADPITGVSDHAVVRALQRITGTISDADVAAAEHVADLAGFDTAAARDANTELLDRLTSRIDASTVAKIRRVLTSALTDVRAQPVFSCSSNRSSLSSTVGVRVMLPVRGERIPVILVCAVQSTGTATVSSVDADGRRMRGRAAAANVKVLTVYTPRPELGYDGEGIFRDVRAAQEQISSTEHKAAGQAILSQVLRLVEHK